ncbi:MAG: acyl-CoA dehydrogenase family protein [Actinomycetota bacterium]|nr:acyl-CoA dehydrogenase family protein [Actinomycetota bacterium]
MIELDERSREMVAEVRELGRTYMRPMGLESDRTGEPPPTDHPFYAICARKGGLVTKLVGGDEPGTTALTWKPLRFLLTAEESAYWDRGVALSLPGPGLGGTALRSMGTDEQRERFLRPFLGHTRPRWAAMALTEPEAGSDVARIRTRCRRDGDEWVLDGSKMFCSNGARSEWVVVWATVDPALGRDGHRAFVVPRDTPGFELLRVEHKMGSRGYETASFALDGVRVPAENLLGGEERYRGRRGFKGAMATFNLTRPVHAAQGVGMGRAAADHALAFVRDEYPAHGRRRQRALERLAEIRRGLHTARLICLHAAWLAREGRDNALEASYSKLFAPPVVFDAVSAALEIVGEAGVRRDHHLEKLYRDVKILDIGEGTQQVQRLVVGRRLFGLPKET